MTGSTLDGGTPEAAADVRAREVEEQMTDQERFAILVSVMGSTPQGVWPRDERIPEGHADELGLHAGRAAPGCPGAADERREPRCHQPRVPEGDTAKRCPQASTPGPREPVAA
jgi:beta-glucosidase